MPDPAALKQIVIDLFLGSKQPDLAKMQSAELKTYDPDFKILQSTLTSDIINAAKARRALLDIKPTDLKAFGALLNTHGHVATHTADVVEAMIQQKVKGAVVPPNFVTPLMDARKKDLLNIEKNTLAPAVDRYLSKWNKTYEITNGQLHPKAAPAKADAAEPDVDDTTVRRLGTETDEITTVLAAEKTLFNGKSPLDAASVSTFTKDKLSFLPNAVRGGDTKKLLAEEKLAVEAINAFTTACKRGPQVLNASHDTFKVAGKVYRGAGIPLMTWTNRQALVSYRDELVKLLRNIRQHLDQWMAQRTTARLDLKSKKVIACTHLAGQVDTLIDAYTKIL
ncbi:MAG: hypothetical protein ACTHN5_23700 [Phycisphaerae bacterium]